MRNNVKSPHVQEVLKAQREEDRKIRREIKERDKLQRMEYGKCKNSYIECSHGILVIKIGNDENGWRNVEVPTCYENIIRSEHWYHVNNESSFQCTLSAEGPVRDLVRAFQCFGRDPDSIRTIALRRVVALCAWGHLGRLTKTFTVLPYCYLPLQSLTCNVYYTDQHNIERSYTPDTWKDAYVEDTK